MTATRCADRDAAEQLAAVVDGSQEERARNQGLVVATQPFDVGDVRFAAGGEHQHVVRHLVAGCRAHHPTRAIDADDGIAKPDVDPVPLVPPGGAEPDVVENVLAGQDF